jgi:hypothetical protein
LEAGVDGRPDAEREEEEKGMSTHHVYAPLIFHYNPLTLYSGRNGGRPTDIHSWPDETRARRGSLP